MNQLRRKLASLWSQREEEHDGQHLNNGQNLGARRSSYSSSSSLEVPAALGINHADRGDGGGVDVLSAASDRESRHPTDFGHRKQDPQEDERKEKGEADEEEKLSSSGPRVLPLSYPWGSLYPVPPPGWTSSSSRSISQAEEQHQQRQHDREQQQRQQQEGSSPPESCDTITLVDSLRLRRGAHGDHGGSAGGVGVGGRLDGDSSHDNNNGAIIADGVHLLSPSVRPLGAPDVSTLRSSPKVETKPGVDGRTRRAREDKKGERECDEEKACAYSRSYRSGYRSNNSGSYTVETGSATTKRSRAEEKDKVEEDGEDNESVADLHQRQRRRRPQEQASQRRRTCPADSVFVSPAEARRSISCSNVGATAVAVAAHEDEGDLEKRWSLTPSRLTFRAGFFKALLGGRAAAKRARSGAKVKKVTRGRQSEIIRETFLSAHPPPPSENEQIDPSCDFDVRDGGGGESHRAVVPRRPGGVRDTGVMVSMRVREDDELWKRITQVEAEHGKEADEKGMARRRRLENLRAEALEAFRRAQEAHAELVAAANAAFDAAEGVDMATLRNLFTEGANSPSLRFKDSSDVIALKEKYAALEALLKRLKEAETAGDTNGLEALLEAAAASNARNQTEVVSASRALQASKDLEAKDNADKEAEAKRVAATAAAAVEAAAKESEAQRAKDKDAALAIAKAKAESARQPTTTTAVPTKAKEDEEQELAEAAAMAAAAASVAEERDFFERIDRLKAAVRDRRGAIDDVLKNPDPGVKRIRMGFKKSYQGCLNKLSVTPATVRQVVDDIHAKAKAPLAEATRAGWEANAKEFLYFNLADKLVDYSERDHFSGDSYRMAFPLACVAMDLMAEHAGLSELFLGTLYTRCPSAVPALSFDTAGLSDQEVMALLGQTGDEDMSAFLNRTKGLVVLMASIMQTPPHGGATTDHPLPLSQGWCWLARFVNGLSAYVAKGNPPPVPTGPVLEWFLKVAGFELQRRYGNAFDKVVQTIKTEVLPILLPKTMVPHLLDVVLADYEGRRRRFLPPVGRAKEFRDFRAWGDT